MQTIRHFASQINVPVFFFPGVGDESNGAYTYIVKRTVYAYVLYCRHGSKSLLYRTLYSPGDAAARPQRRIIVDSFYLHTHPPPYLASASPTAMIPPATRPSPPEHPFHTIYSPGDAAAFSQRITNVDSSYPHTHTHTVSSELCCAPSVTPPATRPSPPGHSIIHVKAIIITTSIYIHFVCVTSAVMNTPLSRPPPQGRLHRKLIVISHGCILYGYTCHRCTIIEVYMHEKCTLSNIHGYPSWLHLTR